MAANPATGQEAGAVYVSVMPSGRGFTASMNRELIGAFSSAQASGISSFGRFFTRIAAAGAGILAAIGLKNLVRDTISLGVSYNTLEQSSKAAFTTLLGTADAALAMQKSIREFAMTSPFPRQAFIKGTQQLLAFGFTAEQVIPTLDAVQDAVAAAGGGSQQLEEILFVMAQIRAAGKITGIDLIQFGQRGINAAELIGSQMGMTGAEIRDAITEGAISADQAIDALTKGMATKFAGAADNLKSTFVGSVDRIRGVTRDLSSALVAPFVDPQGGGYVVEWANKLADFLREYEKSPAFASLTGKLEAFGAALDPIVNKLFDAFGRLLAGGGAEGFFADLQELTKASPFFSTLLVLLDALKPLLPAIGDALEKLGPVLSQGLADLVPELIPLVPILVDLIIKVLPALVDLLVQLLPLLIDLAVAVLPTLLPVLVEFTSYIAGAAAALSALFALMENPSATQAFLNNLFAIQGPAGDMIRNMISLIVGYLGVVSGFVNGIIASIETLINSVASLLGIAGTITLPRVSLPTDIDYGDGPGKFRSAVKMAAGGTILPRPGGTLILAAEAGRAESVVDTGKLNDLLVAASSGMDGGANINVYPRPEHSEEKIGRAAMRAYNETLRGLL